MTKYCNFSFFKIDPKWRWMSDLAKDESSKEVQNIIINSNKDVSTYSTLGLQANSEFVLRAITNSIEEIQTMISKLYLTVFGKYIMPTNIYTSIISNTNEESQSTKNDIEPKKYMMICPLIKKPQWSNLDKIKKQKCIQTCLEVTKKHEKVIFNYSESIDIGKVDAILTLESSNLSDLQNIVNELNCIILEYVDVSSTICIQKNMQKLIISLG